MDSLPALQRQIPPEPNKAQCKLVPGLGQGCTSLESRVQSLAPLHLKALNWKVMEKAKAKGDLGELLPVTCCEKRHNKINKF